MPDAVVAHAWRQGENMCVCVCVCVCVRVCVFSCARVNTMCMRMDLPVLGVQIVMGTEWSLGGMTIHLLVCT